MNTEQLDNIKLFISNEFGRDITNLDYKTSVEKDLGIYGDDAVEFIISFGKKFEVDVSNFMAKKYFSAEGDFILPAIFRLIIGKRKTKEELTIKNLVDAIHYRKLDEETIRISNKN